MAFSLENQVLIGSIWQMKSTQAAGFDLIAELQHTNFNKSRQRSKADCCKIVSAATMQQFGSVTKLFVELNWTFICRMTEYRFSEVQEQDCETEFLRRRERERRWESEKVTEREREREKERKNEPKLARFWDWKKEREGERGERLVTEWERKTVN